MRAAFFAALLMLGTTACLRGTTGTDPDASSNGNNNNNNGSNGSNGNTNHPDAGTNSHPDASNGSNGNMPDGGTTGGFQCKNKVSSVGTGHHNAGADCMQCHSDFSVAGTLYTTGTGSTAISGATITVIDASGQSQDLVTQANGNFYSFTAVTFPLKIYASECQISQTAQMMVSQVQSSSNGGCNSGACHGGSQGAVHLP
jgi:hypothetical protein